MEIKIQTPENKIDIEELLSHFNQTLKDLPKPNNCTYYSPVYGKDKMKEALAEADKWWGPFIIESNKSEFVNGYLVGHISDEERTAVTALMDYIFHQKDIISKLGECIRQCLDKL